MYASRLRVVIACALAILLVTPGGALASDADSSASVQLSSASLARGESITVEGSGWQPDSTVRLESWTSDDMLGQVLVHTDGEFHTQATVPRDVPTGSHTLRFTGVDTSGDIAVLHMTARVTDGSTERVIGGLATSDGHLSAIGTAVLLTGVVGAGAWIADRRLAPRRSSHIVVHAGRSRRSS